MTRALVMEALEKIEYGQMRLVLEFHRLFIEIAFCREQSGQTFRNQLTVVQLEPDGVLMTVRVMPDFDDVVCHDFVLFRFHAITPFLSGVRLPLNRINLKPIFS